MGPRGRLNFLLSFINLEVSFAPTVDGSAPTANSTELNDRRSSMVSNGELADYYRYS